MFHVLISHIFLLFGPNKEKKMGLTWLASLVFVSCLCCGLMSHDGVVSLTQIQNRLI